MSATLAYPRGSVCDENAAAARSALHDVYAAPDFRHLDDPTQQNPLVAILDALGNALSRGAGALGPVGAIVLAAAVLGGGAGAGVAPLARVGRAARRRRRGAGRRRRRP